VVDLRISRASTGSPTLGGTYAALFELQAGAYR
jgi:hypothetical protein